MRMKTFNGVKHAVSIFLSSSSVVILSGCATPATIGMSLDEFKISTHQTIRGGVLPLTKFDDGSVVYVTRWQMDEKRQNTDYKPNNRYYYFREGKLISIKNEIDFQSDVRQSVQNKQVLERARQDRENELKRQSRQREQEESKRREQERYERLQREEAILRKGEIGILIVDRKIENSNHIRFTADIQNNTKKVIRDITIKCSYYAPSGTELRAGVFGADRETLYYTWAPDQLRQVSFKVINVAKADKVYCAPVHWKAS
jgi:hypothetical protein